MENTAIELDHVTAHYGLKPILDDISLGIQQGTRVAVIGPNGVGKSTLMRVLGGAFSPQFGTVQVENRTRRSSADEELFIRGRVTFVPDENWFPWQRTAREFLMDLGDVYGVAYRRLLEHLPRLLALFHLNEVADSPISACSTGQQKKVSLCAGLITETPILLFDEPFSGGLDPAGILAFRQVLRRMGETRERTVVFTTPVPEFVEDTADRVLVLRNGKIVEDLLVPDLQRQLRPGETFSAALQEIVFPDAMGEIQDYLSSEQTAQA